MKTVKLTVEMTVPTETQDEYLREYVLSAVNSWGGQFQKEDILFPPNWEPAETVVSTVPRAESSDLQVLTKNGMFHTPENEAALAKWIEGCGPEKANVYMGILMATNLLIDKIEKGLATIEVKS